MLEPSSYADLGPYLQILQMIKRAVILVDESGKILGLNKSALDQLDYREEEAREKTILEINPHYTILSWRKIWRSLQKEGSFQEEDTEFISSHDVIYPVHTNITLLDTGEHQLACIIVENKLETDRYRDLLDITTQLSRIGCWELDFINRKAIITEEAFSILDMTPAQDSYSFAEANQLLRTIFSPEDFDRLDRLSRKAIENGTSFELECRVYAPGGNKHTLTIKGVPQISEERAAKLYGTVQDISDISARSEDMYMAKFVLENMRDLILWVREDGSIFYANDKACRTLGATRRQIQATSLFELLPQPTKPEWPQFWKEMQQNGSLKAETTLLTRQKQQIPAAVTHNYLSYESTGFDCLYIRDLREEKARDELIHMVHFTLNQSNDLIFWARRDGSIFYFNDSVPAQLGYPPETLRNMTLFDLNPDLTSEAYQRAWNIIEQEDVLITEHPYYRANGSTFQVESHATYIKYRDQECCCITMRDITARVEKEKALQKALEENQALRERAETQKSYLQEEVTSSYNFNNIISKSKNYQRILKQIAQVADSESTVLIQGETGTGKELLARAVHGLSNREDSPLIKVNCAALPAELIESELFGHEKGAFTGAYQRKIGKFELADGGTIFLDEVGELPLELQPKLLRVLQEGEFERVGDPTTRSVDVRVIAATNRNLQEMVREKTFREDLFFRLNVFPIYNLPLRERRDDIPLLIQHFLDKYNTRSGKNITKVSEASVEKLMHYEFPGNIRELENLIERAVIISNEEELDLETVLPNLTTTNQDTQQFPTLEEVEKQHILEALRRTRGRVTGEQGAAKLLGMNGKTLASRMRKWNINRMDFLD